MEELQPIDQYSKLSSIVDHACIVLELSVNHYYNKFLAIACWELTELKLDVANEVKTVRLPISDVNTCTLPPDCVDWTKIAVEDGQFVRTLSINGDLSKIDRTLGDPVFSHSVSPGWLPNGLSVGNYLPGFEFSNYGGQALFAQGGGLPQDGQFQVVRKLNGCKEILLAHQMNCTELYVEYISLGINPCGETIVNPYLKDYVLKAIFCRYEERQNPTRTEASIRRCQQDLAFAEVKVRGRVSTLTLEGVLCASRKGFRLTAHA